ncbi:hypothetical protein M885DRAFT_611081 [Pelagophyceae sp. CCMP2097]|nr:hypothetical protein M885DRAFT_611081 [Pelagophyceae sp. CCMP2097]
MLRLMLLLLVARARGEHPAESGKKEHRIDLRSILPALAPPQPMRSCGRKHDFRSGEKYLVLLGAREQATKNIGVISEAASWAKSLKRTFVEPAMCNSRVVSPFFSEDELGPILRKNKHLYDWTYPECPGEILGVSAFRDPGVACTAVPIMGLGEFRTMLFETPGGLAMRDSSFEFWAHASHDHGYGRANTAPPRSDARVLYIDRNFRRALPNHAVTNGACVHQPCFGPFQWPYSPRLVGFVERTAIIATFFAKGVYACVQWRSETRASDTTVLPCAKALANATKLALRSEGVVPSDVPVVLVTDLYDKTSGTYPPSHMKRAALHHLEKELLLHTHDHRGKFIHRRLLSPAPGAAATGAPPERVGAFDGALANRSRPDAAPRFAMSRDEEVVLAELFRDRGLDDDALLQDLRGGSRRRLSGVGSSGEIRARFALHSALHGHNKTRDTLEDSIIEECAPPTPRERPVEGRTFFRRLLCARAPIIVMCITPSGKKSRCGQCARGLDSGYVSSVRQSRNRFKRSCKLNGRGGIWSWPSDRNDVQFKPPLFDR